MTTFKRIALMGSLGNPNIGDEAVLLANIKKLEKQYGDNCKIYVFTKDASYTSMFCSQGSEQIIAVDYLHQFTKECGYDIEVMKQKQDELVEYSDQKNGYHLAYSALHHIFSEIEVFHFIGGGYINSLWPDMLFEVYLATKLAKKYRVKYCFTGISIFPYSEKYKDLLQEAFDGAEFVDFRDRSYECANFKNTDHFVTTIDDALYLEDPFPNDQKSSYISLAFHPWRNNREKVVDLLQNVICPFCVEHIEKNDFKSVKVLGFSEGDIELWNDVNIPEELQEHIEYIPLFIDGNVENAKHLCANAKFNIGSRFHEAVFSLSSAVPVLSVSYDDYYENKLKSIHKLYRSNYVVDIDDANMKVLDDFAAKPCIDNYEEFANYCALRRKEKETLLSKVYNYPQIKTVGFMKNGSMPKVSVIIPIYNMEAYLREALDSVIKQTLRDIEIICVNDGSTDYTQLILEEYSWKDQRIKVISQSNHGVAYSRNTAVSKATGEYLYFLDPDDWIPDERVLEDLYRTAKDQNVMICGGRLVEHCANGVVNKNWLGHQSKYSFEKNGLMPYKDYQFDYGWVRFIYNREFIVKNNLTIPDTSFYEDPVFFVNVMDKAEYFYGMDRDTYAYRTGYKSATLSLAKVCDLLKGMYQIIELSEKKGYDQLKALEIFRMNNDFAEEIVRYLPNENAGELRSILEEINKLLYDGNNRIEYQIYESLLKKSKQTANPIVHVSDSQQVIDEIYASTTWKIGNAIMYLPKLIKDKMNGGKND